MRHVMKTLACIAVLIGSSSLTGPVSADDAVQLKAGTVQVGSEVSLSGGAFAIAGTQEFSYTGGAEGGTSQAECGPCLAGDTRSLTTELSGTYFGTLTYRGQTYELDISNGSGSFTFASPEFVLPQPGGEDVVIIEQPFNLVDTSVTLPDGTVVPIEGSGTATARYSTFQDGEDTYYFLIDVTYTF
jgi:hypothetical protein